MTPPSDLLGPRRCGRLRGLTHGLVGSLCALLFVSCAALPGAPQQFQRTNSLGPSVFERIRQVNARIGVLQLEDERWGALDSPTVFAVDYVESIGVDWLALEGGLGWAYDESRATIPSGPDAGERVDESLAFFAFSAGLLASPPPDRWRLRPYIGAGGLLAWSDVDSIVGEELVDDDDNALGGYAKAGLLFQITGGTHIGVEVRWMDTQSITAGDQSLDLDGVTVAIVFGAAFDWFDF